jgi:hypothetical protein
MIKINNLDDKLLRLGDKCITIESEVAEGTGFLMKDGQFAMLTTSNGYFTANAEVAKELFLEAIDVIDTYADNRNIMVNQLQKDQGHSKQCVRSRQKKAG